MFTFLVSISKVLVPSEAKTLHLYEARYLALLEEVKKKLNLFSCNYFCALVILLSYCTFLCENIFGLEDDQFVCCIKVGQEQDNTL